MYFPQYILNRKKFIRYHYFRVDGLRSPNSDLEGHYYRVDGRPKATDIEYQAFAGLKAFGLKSQVPQRSWPQRVF